MLEKQLTRKYIDILTIHMVANEILTKQSLFPILKLYIVPKRKLPGQEFMYYGFSQCLLRQPSEITC